MRCSTEGCAAEAVRQWLRPATDAETAAHLDALRAGIARATEARRLQLRLQIAELQAQAANVPATLAASDARAFRDRAAQQIEALTVEHDTADRPVDLNHHLPVAVAVFGCAAHDHQEGVS